MSQKVIEHLRSFNSKERFFLLSDVLGNNDFEPSDEFRKKLSSVLKIEVPKPEFSAMDYHLDWIYASLSMIDSERTIFCNKDRYIKGQHEDIDYIIAFKLSEACHIVLIEAKGVGGWTNKQMESKSTRMKQIFGDSGQQFKCVIPHFILMSPSKPRKLKTTLWPKWMAPNDDFHWIELKLPPILKLTTRCDEKDKICTDGEYWKVINRTKG